ncbi:MAG: translation initiation factor IF-2 [Microcoleus sp. PH2017_29_MFU_D_A]|jgi:translation initiation factor IF-2|uniref:translation initiation factor IF-2 n=1 Tax=unclassified Microcoleus TaxID=2642155 RepID=UPI001DDE89F1|nr:MULTISPECIES: translation initiation factor IF-2 [unclassified Microcoleus]MCC3421314.1 translation initiation factor IF-2 [Microcoleus sp. PH2017_07_MST_O_A]MCC3431145.1 translation initiation factor IF-2 [Microcoleus sp. PH2017_04_SCI_O_A]MCC3441632.1 translation initiation factor IF-2 [Microcoleus sp. PH2017_03_ELD_O_A]MCC3468728.1 translation initiation factor IF-2 [Microcoleus sp. PH2017_06_SFM_O_A]MCC3503220.1 translation initiation factor IF-2 [Microcoleus sp. PH2017_19_SFW_U_A]MCC3
MNNGKVRIYELSRELNLDNKDILAVCERLNISVKSHSSTITESEAERIRKTAEKYVASHSTPGKPAPPERAAAPSRESGPHPNDQQKKQQILEIRSPKVRPAGASSQPAGNEEQKNQPGATVATPPKSPASQQLQPPAKPNINRPVLSKPNVAGAAAASETSSETVGAIAPETSSQAQAPATPQPPSEKAPERTPRPPVAPPAPPAGAKLTSPPVRAASEQAGRNPQTLGNKPVLKLARTDQDQSEQGETLEAPAKPSRPSRPAPSGSDAQRPRPGAGGPVKTALADRPQQGGPRRSLAPATSAAGLRSRGGDISATGEDADDDGDDTSLLLDTLLLPKPTLPKPAKKTQVIWEEDDDENSDAAKAAKAAKAKNRRLKPIDEDDDDLENGLDMPAPVTVSLSLARPAKAKTQAAPKSTPTPGAPGSSGKNKRPGPSHDKSSSGSSGGRGNRGKTAEAKVERPEKLLLSRPMTVQELAVTLAVPETEIIKRLFSKGIAVNITETLDIPAVRMVAEEMGVEVETPEIEEPATKIIEMIDEADLEYLQRRPPVVTIMGHVDHGKTTLLDSIRKTKVAQGEAGGITQHIGAYHVDVVHEGKSQQVVFLDTPGHEAFTAMRARGTRVTDIAILVVAADDGVRPQTIEAISHAKAAKVPIVVAINKVDKEGAQPERVKQELTEYGLVADDWGGDVTMVPVSAIRGENLDTLLEMILTVAEMEDLNANPNRAAKGTVIEAHLDKARGPVATLLVQNGTLRVGDIVVAGSALGKVRAMIDDRGDRVDQASPSFAVEVLGLREVPQAGDEFDVFANEKEAAAIASGRATSQRDSRLLQGGRISLSGFSQQAKEGVLKELNLILKADVQGSLEAIVGSLTQLPQKEVQLRLLLSAPGEITETDIDLASASNAVIIGFNTTLATGARQAADQAGVDVREYSIIYKLLDDIQGAMEGLLEPELVEEPLGKVEVRAVFAIGRGAVAGCYVLEGKVIRNCKVRVRRGNNVVYEGVLDSLKRMKEDAKEVNTGYECGISLSGFSDWAEGDIIEAYRMVTKRRTLSQ